MPWSPTKTAKEEVKKLEKEQAQLLHAPAPVPAAAPARVTIRRVVKTTTP